MECVYQDDAKWGGCWGISILCHYLFSTRRCYPPAPYFLVWNLYSHHSSSPVGWFPLLPSWAHCQQVWWPWDGTLGPKLQGRFQLIHLNYANPYVDPNPTTRCSLHYCCPVQWKITFANNTLQYLYDVWELFSAHYLEPDPPLTSLLECVHGVESSISVTWLVPSYLIPQTIKKVKANAKFLQRHGIWNVTVADQCIYDEQEAIDNTSIVSLNLSCLNLSCQN